jgi:hypothetical protein
MVIYPHREGQAVAEAVQLGVTETLRIALTDPSVYAKVAPSEKHAKRLLSVLVVSVMNSRHARLCVCVCFASYTTPTLCVCVV